MKNKFPNSQIILTFAIGGVLIFAIGAITISYMTNGRYLFHFKMTSEGVEITTDLDKRENHPEKKPKYQENTEDTNLNN